MGYLIWYKFAIELLPQIRIDVFVRVQCIDSINRKGLENCCHGFEPKLIANCSVGHTPSPPHCTGYKLSNYFCSLFAAMTCRTSLFTVFDLYLHSNWRTAGRWTTNNVAEFVKNLKCIGFKSEQKIKQIEVTKAELFMSSWTHLRKFYPVIVWLMTFSFLQTSPYFEN